MGTTRADPDHPRSRGEYEVGDDLLGGPGGSSPLSRGIPRYGQDPQDQGRIIPALAGNTAAVMPGWWWTQDHPRSRGEYTTRATAADMLVGSSPLSRGIPQGGYLTAARARIIPALAGNTPRGGHEEPARKDHPRSRGEYRLETVNDLDDRGSSPLSRGIHAMAFSSRTSRRIIPALAGNT